MPEESEARELSAQAKVALGAGDDRPEAGFVAALDGEIEADTVEGCREFLRLGAQHFKIIQSATLEGVNGRMDGVGAPFDEEGEKAVAVVGKVDGFPSENAAIGTFSGAVGGAREGDFVFAELLGDG